MRWLLLVLLAGCVSPAEQAKRDAYEQEQFRAARAARIDRECRQMGFKPDQPDYRQCVLTLYTQARQQDSADRAIIMQQMLRR